MIRSLLHVIFKTNITKTLYLNFKMLPLKQAMYLPMFVYGKAKFRELNGNIKIEGKIHPGMIKIGKNDYYVRTSIPMTYWIINGNVIFRGKARFMNGGYMCVSRKGIVNFGEDFLIGSNYKLMCFDNLEIGNSVRAAYDVQIYDTSFHYIEKPNGDVDQLTKPIQIGNYIWIGNSTTITKGAILPDKTMVAALSLVNKNFSKFDGEGILLAGIPATIKSQNVYRIFDQNKEKLFDKKFGYDRTHL